MTGVDDDATPSRRAPRTRGSGGRPECPNLVRAVRGTGNHVLHTFDGRLRQRGAYEVELAGARLAVTLRDRPNRTVVFDDPIFADRDLFDTPIPFYKSDS